MNPEDLSTNLNNLSTDTSRESTKRAASLIETSNEVEIEFADGASTLQSSVDFESIVSNPNLLKGIFAMGFKKPSKIQSVAVPLLLAQPPKNFIGQSQSGTGKTGAFSVAILSKVDSNIPATQALVLAPTRELASQILEVLKQMSTYCNVSCCLAVKDSVPRGGILTDHVIVGTPGTIVDLFKKKSLVGDHIKMFVIDEADVMLDNQGMGDQTIKVRRFLAKQVQVVLFSATYREDVARFAERVVPDANKIKLKREELSVDAITQLWIDCTSLEKKGDILSLMYGVCTIGQSIIFCNTKDTVEKVAQRLRADGHSVTVIHGDLESTERDRIFSSYKSGETKVLISTNVLARGIDVLDVNVVVNYDLPTDKFRKPDYETYLHRIGRTGRFGRKGISVNFVHDEKSNQINQEIQAYYGKQIIKVNSDNPEIMEKELKEALKKS